MGLIDHPGVLSDFAAYDSELNRLVAEQSFAVICLWDLQSFGGDVVAELLLGCPTYPGSTHELEADPSSGEYLLVGPQARKCLGTDPPP